jgi:hypothetical protein
VGDEFLHGGGDEDDLVNGEAAGEPGAAAAVAAFRGKGMAGDVERDAEVARSWSLRSCRRAEAADEALGEEGAHGGGDEEGLDAHVDQAGNAADGVVGVEGGETRWPVREARMAISAVSRSRISPIITTFGSARRMERRPAAKVRLISGDGDLHDAREFVFHRVLDGDDAAVGVVHLAEEGVEAGGFAGAGGAGDEDDAVGQVSSASIWSHVRDSIMSFCEVEFSWLSRRSETLSPSTVGTVATRTSMLLPSNWRLMRPSWGRRRSAMSRRDMIFKRAITELWRALMFSGTATSMRRPSMR